MDASATVPSTLKQKMQEHLTADDALTHDPFRTAATKAVVTVLGEATTRRASVPPEASPAETFGRRLGAIPLDEVVARFTTAFLQHVLDSIVTRADPDITEPLTRDAVDHMDRKSEQIARRTVRRAQDDRKLRDSAYLRNVVAEELHQAVKIAAPAAAGG